MPRLPVEKFSGVICSPKTDVSSTARPRGRVFGKSNKTTNVTIQDALCYTRYSTACNTPLM